MGADYMFYSIYKINKNEVNLNNCDDNEILKKACKKYGTLIFDISLSKMNRSNNGELDEAYSLLNESDFKEELLKIIDFDKYYYVDEIIEQY